MDMFIIMNDIDSHTHNRIIPKPIPCWLPIQHNLMPLKITRAGKEKHTCTASLPERSTRAWKRFSASGKSNAFHAGPGNPVSGPSDHVSGSICVSGPWTPQNNEMVPLNASAVRYLLSRTSPNQLSDIAIVVEAGDGQDRDSVRTAREQDIYALYSLCLIIMRRRLSGGVCVSWTG